MTEKGPQMTTKPCNQRPVECSDPTCPCHEWSQLANLALKTLQEGLGESAREIDLPSLKTSLTAREGARTPLLASDFTSEWLHAPRSMTNYVEQEVAELWFRAGMRARERELLGVFNEDLRELLRVGREKLMR